MKYFNPSYWFKMWVLSAPLFNSKNEGIYAKSIDNQNIKDWASKNTTNISFLENQEITLSNNQTSLLNLPSWNTNLTTYNQYHKHHHQKSRNRNKRNDQPSINLNVPEVRQVQEYWCGPAIAEAVLRYFNINTASPILPEQILGHVNYNYMDPGNGHYHTIADYQLFTLFGDSTQYNNNFILSYNPIIPPNPIQEPTEMEFGIFNSIINQLLYISITDNLRILLGYNFRRNLNCHNKRKRDLNNNYWDEQFCDLKPKIDKLHGEVKLVKILDENIKDKNLKVGDVFVGTTEGLYLIHDNVIVLKAINIDNSETMSITKFKNNNFYVTTKEEHVYFLNTKFINEGNLLGQRIWNAESSNLEKELKLYFDEKHQNKQLDFTPVIHNYWNTKSFLLNLDKISPIDNYEKLEFLGDVYSNGWGVKTQWGSWIYDGNPENHKHEKTYDIRYYMKDKDNRNNKFHDIIENTKNDVSKNKVQYLQSFEDWDGSAHILVDQRFGLTFYWDNKYYMKVFGLQYCEWWTSAADFNCHMKMGNGIRLYNDDESIRTKREIFEEKNDLKNLTKWTDEFTKSINHEQHLAINNKTNFSTNNITSL